MRIIISGGGTGGHIYPAIAIAQKLKEKRPDAEILFVGAKGRMEMEKVPKAGFEIEALWISGLQRKLTWKNVLFPLKLVHSLWRSRQIIKRFKPDAAIGVGGYASGPLLRAASGMRIPTLIQEQNSYPGITNRWLAGKVDRICVAYDQMEKYFPSEKIVQTGNPVRKDILELKDKYKEALTHFRLSADKKTMLVFGGSLGARTLNEAMRSGAELIEKNKDVQIIWQMGKFYKEEFESCRTAQLEQVVVLPFIERMDLAYAAADVVICRAGALAISELSLAAKASILVPSPYVAEDHQTKNAFALSEKGAALLIKDSEASEVLLAKAMKLIHDEERCKKLEKHIKALGKPDAAEEIADELLSLIKEK